MKYHFIINPTAGKTNASKFLPLEIQKMAVSLQMPKSDYHIHITQTGDDACKLAETISKSGEECVIFAAGGDGTFSKILGTVYKYKNVSVGCLPYGSGNDFLRSFGERSEFLDLENQFLGNAIEIDLIKTNTGISSCICSVGLDAQIGSAMQKFRKIPLCGGAVAYKLATVERLLYRLGEEYEIEIDDEKTGGTYLLGAFCNGKFYGGGFNAAPEADLTDGLIDVVLVNKINLLQIAKVIKLYKNGEHIKNGEVAEKLKGIVEFKRAKSVKLFPRKKGAVLTVNIDGEVVQSDFFSAEVLNFAGKVFLPKTVFEKTKNAKLQSV